MAPLGRVWTRFAPLAAGRFVALRALGVVALAREAAQVGSALLQPAVDGGVGRASGLGDLAVAVADREEVEVAPLARFEGLQVGDSLGVLETCEGLLLGTGGQRV